MSEILRLRKKRILYALCFLVFCIIDQRIKTVSGLEGWSESFRDLTGVVMAVLIISHYRPEEFIRHKIPYIVWSLVCVTAGIAFVIKGQPLVYFMNERVVLMLAAFLFGIILIHIFMYLVVEKRSPGLNKPFALAWLAMMALMAVSRSEYLWPIAYLVMFGCFYLTDYTAYEREELFQGMLDGIILGFFLMQGWCFVFRPYDAVRYRGVYNNCNMNALFYLVVLAAVLTKLIYVYGKECGKWIRLYYWLGTGAVLGFLFMTISRTGWLTAVALVLAALFFLWKTMHGNNVHGNKVPGKNKFVSGILGSFLKNGFIVILCFLITIPLVFCAVRYLPPVFHHPVWFYGEWHENKVHSWDKWDSDKFVNPDRLIRTANERVAKILGIINSDNKGTVGIETEIDERLLSVTPLQQQLYDEMWEAGFAMDPADRQNALLLRKTIYRYYISMLNLTGHPESEQGFQILPDHRIGHAHNIYIQYGVDFGIVVMLLFIALTVWTVVCMIRKFVRTKSVVYAGCLLIVMVPAVFGMLEYSWGAGSLTITMLFVVWRRMICDEREEKEH